MKSKWNLVTLIIIAWLMTCVSSFAEDATVQSTITSSDDLVVGKNCTFEYEITGGSGQYADISIEVQPLIRVDGTGTWIDSDTEYLFDASSGTISFICPAASEIGFRVRCNDMGTGEEYLKYHFFPLKQNPAFPVTFAWEKDEYYYRDEMRISYEVRETVSEIRNAKLVWGYISNLGNIEFPIEQEIYSPIGSASYVPISGNHVFVYLQAEDENGNLIFGQSAPMDLQTDGEYQPISSAVTLPEKIAVGEQCTAVFEVSGGSGQYADIKIVMQPLIRVRGTGTWIGDRAEFDFDTNTGSILFMCPAASEVGFRVQCKDIETGEEYLKYHFFSLEQNPAFPVIFTWGKDKYYYGEEMTVSFEVGGDVSALQNAKVVWGYISNLGNIEFPTEQEIILSTGIATYRPISGNDVFVYLQAEDENGNLIFGQSEPVQISEKTIDTSRLPASLITIGEEAFEGTAIQTVDIPASVTEIADNAFAGSQLNHIIGHNDIVEKYARENGFEYSSQ